MKKKKTNIGRVVQVIGPVVDVEFEIEKTPSIYNALTVSSPPLVVCLWNQWTLKRVENIFRCLELDHNLLFGFTFYCPRYLHQL